MTQIAVNLTTNGIDPNGQHQFIQVDAEHYYLFTEHTLCRTTTRQDSLQIVRDHEGYFVRRIGSEVNGISLSSYLYGKLYMHRIDNSVFDFTADNFKPDAGFPCAYKRYAKVDGSRATETVHLKEMSLDDRGIKILLDLYDERKVCGKMIKHIDKEARRQYRMAAKSGTTPTNKTNVLPFAKRGDQPQSDVTVRIGKVEVMCSVDHAIKILQQAV